MPEVRIVAGSLRGRRITVPPRGVRPTSERLREALMSIIGTELQGARVLDCFAGSGAFGFEALSRGAASVTFVEHGAPVCQHLRNTAESFRVAEQCTVLRGSARGILHRLATTTETRFDLLFFDPPYERGLLDGALAFAPSLAEEGALVIAEHAAEEAVTLPPELAEIAVRCYGGSAVTMARRH